MQFALPNENKSQDSSASSSLLLSPNSNMRHFIVSFILWLILIALSLIPFFQASVMAVGENEIHGIRVGSRLHGTYFHGHNLSCVESGYARDCSMVINGNLLTINARKVDPWTAWEQGRTTFCDATFAGEKISCTVGAVAGPSGGPYSVLSGVILKSDELQASVQSDPDSWQNWRNLFLGHTPEETITNYFMAWAFILFFALYAVLPFFGRSTWQSGFWYKPSRATIIASSFGLLAALGLISIYLGPVAAAIILGVMALCGVILLFGVRFYSKTKQLELNLKELSIGIAVKMAHVTSLVPIIAIVSLMAMIMLGFDD